MRQSLYLGAFTALLSFATATPIEKRSNFAAPPGGDIDILNYALTLEYLERTFYQQGLKNYSASDFAAAGAPESFYKNLQTIAYDETQHVSLLAGALGAKAVKQASYQFPSTNAASFLALASVLEGVGVSAYLGAAQAIVDKMYLTVAGSILTVEARHSAIIRSVIGKPPVPKPYDTPLDFNQVFSLAAQFITGFAPGDPKLPFTAFPPITLALSQWPLITFKGAYASATSKSHISANTPVYAVFFSGLDTYYAQVTCSGNDYTLKSIPVSAKQLPPSGQVYVVLSTSSNNVTDENTLSGVGVLEIDAINKY